MISTASPNSAVEICASSRYSLTSVGTTVRVVSDTEGAAENNTSTSPSSTTSTPKRQQQPPPPHSLIRSLLLNDNYSPSTLNPHSLLPFDNSHDTHKYVPTSITILQTPPPHGHLDPDLLPIPQPSPYRSKLSPSSQGRLRPLIIPMLRSANPLLRSSSPGSPPDLTDSKSSKSSSYPSSSLADSAPTDLSHFEDINLDDVAALSNPWTQDKLGGSTIRNLPTSLPSIRTAQRQRSLRDLTNVSRQSVGQNAGGLALGGARSKFQLPVPGSRSARPRVKHLMGNLSPSHSDTKPSRSPSVSPPATTRNYSPSPRSAGPSSSSGRTRFSSASIHVRRRQSWQPGRKTVKELEDEYHDSDEEVPDDAVIWNVPISPRPPHEREFSASESDTASVLASTLSYQQTRSHGRSVSPGSALDRTDTGLSSASAPAAIDIKRPLSPHSPVSELSEHEYQGHMRRISTRDAALEDLSKEAKELTSALELLAEQSELRTEANVQSRSQKSKSHSSSPTRTIIKAADLPPVRKNDPLIDPLPASKEKERFLTRTRPSWLPPKDQKEEKRHLKEYQAIMARAAEAEQKRMRQMQKIQCERDAIAADRTRQWEERVLPNWNEAVILETTRELYWAGIPSKLRGVLWTRGAGNVLNLTSASYDAALSRAKDAQNRLAVLEEEERLRDPLGALFAHLDVAASTMHADLSIFSPTGPMHQSLKDVCAAYYAYRSPSSSTNTAFAQIPSLAALLLLNLPAPSAFITLANILHRPLASALLVDDRPALQVAYNTILLTLQDKLPSLHAHLLTLATRSAEEMPLSPRATSTNTSNHSTSPLIDALLRPILEAIIFASPKVGIDASSRLLDAAVFEGDSAILRSAVEVLGCLEGRLYASSGEDLAREVGGQQAWSFGETDAFLGRVRGVELGRAFAV